MRLFMFTSRPKPNLRAFTADSAGTKLPEQYGPWDAPRVVSHDRVPPHHFSRAAIEQSIAKEGFQLWVMKPLAKPAPRRKARATA